MRVLSGASLVAVLLAPTSLTAQEMSIDEIINRLEQQRELMAEAAELDLGRTRNIFDDPCQPVETRGLKLVPLGCAETGNAGTVEVTSSEEATDATSDPNKPLVASTVQDDQSSSTPIMVASFPEDVAVNLQIRFEFDSASIAESERPTLEKMCAVMRQSDLGRVRIVGHTDSSGAEDYNQRLSSLRAQEVARYLVRDCGIDPVRMETLGMGERLPFNTANPAADENRRVEFQAMS